MGTDIKALRTRIKSVNSTLHLTKAMGLVAASKIRRANESMQNGREYYSAVNDAVILLSTSPECEKSPYMRQRDKGRTRIIVIAGDRGLAGGYNANVFRVADEYRESEIIPIGKRACERYGKETVSSEYFDFGDAKKLAKSLCDDFANEKYDRLGIIYTKYISMMTQEPQLEWILPICKAENRQSVSVVFEPNELSVLNYAVPEYAAGRIISAVKESFACEVSARRTAMDSAGKNARQMIDDLQLEYNSARQGAITQEITEIVAGSGS